jgi:hypothetical protein
MYFCQFCARGIPEDDVHAGPVRISDCQLVRACARCNFVHSAVFINGNGVMEIMCIASGIWQDTDGNIHRDEALKKFLDGGPSLS